MSLADIFILCAVTIFSIVFGYLIANRYGSRFLIHNLHTHTPENATELLQNGRTEDWNEVRFRNPSWVPDLSNLDLKEISAASANFRKAILNGSTFSNADLRCCNFFEAKANSVDFGGACLSDSIFDGAELDGASFLGSDITNISLFGCDLRNIDIVQTEDKSAFRYSGLSQPILEDMLSENSIIYQLCSSDLKQLVIDLLEFDGYSTSLPLPSVDEGFDICATRSRAAGMQETTLIRIVRPLRMKTDVPSVRSLLSACRTARADFGIVLSLDGNMITNEAYLMMKEISFLEPVDIFALRNWIMRVIEKRKSNNMAIFSGRTVAGL